MDTPFQTRLTRRRVLQMLALASATTGSGCCPTKYAVFARSPAPPTVAAFPALPPLLQPPARAGAAAIAGPVIDVHAHFFNASDVPVRGFVAECLAHRAPPPVRRLLQALARLADRIADRAPTAREEMDWLASLVRDTAELSLNDAQATAQRAIQDGRRAAAQRVADVISDTEFERVYRELKAGAGPALLSTGSPDDILAIVNEAETPYGETPVAPTAQSDVQANADAADGVLGFLYYMLSFRSNNLDAYIAAFRRHERSFGIDQVLGALVDFDYWLDCPPRSPHDEQIQLHGLLSQLHGRFMRPVVAYNPWVDIHHDGAALARVVRAFKEQAFVGVKIYPPTGFMPAGNSATSVKTTKRRPDLQRLDRTLHSFFDTCASMRIPVIAHAARSNGRDHAHDEFSSPQRWALLLSRYTKGSVVPVINVAHFGGGAGVPWTNEFAALVGEHAHIPVYGDIGYWEELMCQATPDTTCMAARQRLRLALEQPIGDRETAANRVMFGTDWLMLSQVKRWADYPARVHDSVRAITSSANAARIFGGNAVNCFDLHS